MDKTGKVLAWFKPLLPYAICALLGAGMAFAAPIKNWTSSEYIAYTDLNNALNHLHANLGHGHGPIITNKDIASNAGIRPEQTTFGTANNRSLVHVGTYKINPDAGNYLPVNYSGTLAVSIVPTSSTEVTITGAANAGVLTDGGLNIYTVFYRPVRLAADPLLTCSDTTAVLTSLVSPLAVRVICADTLSLVAGPATYTRPSGLSVEVYSNATVP